jgi:HEAT repeat protein
MVIDSVWLPILLTVGGGLGLLSVLMLGLCFWYRRRRILRQQTRKRIIEQYRTALFDWIGGETPPLDPPGRENEWRHLIALWNNLYEKVGQSEHDQLRKAADNLGLGEKAREFLDSNETDKRITAVITLGHLGDTDHLDRIEELTTSSVTILKMQSIKALTNLEPKRALTKIYDDLVDNPNQSHNYYMDFCRTIDPAQLTRVTLDRLGSVADETKPRLIPFLEFGKNKPVRTYLREQLNQVENPEILSACLKVLRKVGTPSDQILVAHHLSHSADFVRIQAARALGAIGNSEVVDELKQALSDSNWWVRCRAAESLVQLPTTNLDELKKLTAQLDDQDARQALQSAIDEVDIG